ncbi:MAG: hypothetical protein SF187_20875 [Deltaproteobacteria bacterium]|nr:hypothetical protein [Deltaproteobacteria bacterium]
MHARRRQRLRVAIEALIVVTPMLCGASHWMATGAVVGGLLVLTVAALWVWWPRGTLHRVALRFDQVIADGGARDDRVLCAYEFIDANTPLSTLALQQGQQAAARVKLQAVAPLQPRFPALALAGSLGLVSLMALVQPPARSAVVASGERLVAKNVLAQRHQPRRKRLSDVIGEAFKAAPALEQVGEAVAAQDTMALQAATAALNKTLPVQAPHVAAGLAIARFELAQQRQAPPFAPQAMAAEDESDETQNGAQGTNDDEDERTLSRLERGLNEAEDICARDPQACADAVANLNQQLERLAAKQADGEAQAQAQAETQGSKMAAPTQAESAQRSMQGAPQAPQASTTTGSSHPDPQARRPAPAIAGVATQDVAVNLGGAAPDRAELVAATGKSAERQRPAQTRYSLYRQRAEAVVANQAIPEDRRAVVRSYFQSLRPQQLAGGATRD